MKRFAYSRLTRSVAALCAAAVLFSSCSILENSGISGSAISIFDFFGFVSRDKFAESLLSSCSSLEEPIDLSSAFDNGHEFIDESELYGFSLLENDEERELYARIRETSLLVRTVLLVDDLSLSVNECHRVFTYFQYDNPQISWLYYVDYIYFRQKYDSPFAMALLYCEGSNLDFWLVSENKPEEKAGREAIKQKAEELAKHIGSIAAEIPAGSSELEKERFAHDHIALNVQYDYDHLENIREAENNDDDSLMTNWHSSDAYGALILKKAVCSGISEAFQYLLYVMGVQSAIVMGIAEGGAHQWNAVKIGENFFHVDITWNITQKRENETGFHESYLKYKYYNLSDIQLAAADPSREYTVYRDQQEGFDYGYARPVCEDDSLGAHFGVTVELSASGIFDVQDFLDAAVFAAQHNFAFLIFDTPDEISQETMEDALINMLHDSENAKPSFLNRASSTAGRKIEYGEFFYRSNGFAVVTLQFD